MWASNRDKKLREHNTLATPQEDIAEQDTIKVSRVRGDKGRLALNEVERRKAELVLHDTRECLIASNVAHDALALVLRHRVECLLSENKRITDAK